jgi:hypothetical protein
VVGVVDLWDMGEESKYKVPEIVLNEAYQKARELTTSLRESIECRDRINRDLELVNNDIRKEISHIKEIKLFLINSNYDESKLKSLIDSMDVI